MLKGRELGRVKDLILILRLIGAPRGAKVRVMSDVVIHASGKAAPIAV